MDKYKLLLVDDEEEVIQVIMKKICWEELGFTIVGYANNGIKAFEMVEELSPDVVMTDIKMPFMDGMELSNRIRTEFPAIKILFFTGFDEFEYAKEAIHLEAQEYILKPVNSVELTNVFTQLKTKLDQEISEKRNVEILQQYYLESLPLLQANFYTSLIENKIREDEIAKYLSDYQLAFPGPFFCCLVIHTSAHQIPADMNPLLLSASVNKQAKERLAEKWQAKCFSYLGNTILIPQLKDENEAVQLTDDCDKFCKYAHSIIGAVVTIGIGGVCDNLLSLPQSYNSAREAVSYRVIYGSSRAINMKEIVPRQINKSAPAHDNGLSTLFKMIRLGSPQEVMKAADNYWKYTLSPEKSLQQHNIDVMELISSLYRFSINNDITVENFSGDLKALYGNLLELEPDALQKWLTDCCLSLREKLILVRNKSAQSLVEKAKEYVHNHYAREELSLDCICKVLGVSNSYFSTLFKKETGHSFVSYLTDYRMEQSALLLIETSEKSYIIAQRVGYTDPNYFSYVFKRKFGVSPSKYREGHTESEK